MYFIYTRSLERSHDLVTKSSAVQSEMLVFMEMEKIKSPDEKPNSKLKPPMTTNPVLNPSHIGGRLLRSCVLLSIKDA